MSRSFIVLCLLLLSSASHGETTQREPQRDRISPRTIDSTSQRKRLPSEFQRKLASARHLYSRQQRQAAADLLEVLLEEAPGHPEVQNLLRSCYVSLKLFGKAESLARRMLEDSPANHAYLLFLAETLGQQNKAAEALEVYGRARNLLSAFQTDRYRQIIASMKKHGFESEALGLIDSVRAVTGDASLYAVERGGILEIQKKYTEAAREYLPLLAEDTTPAAGAAEKRLMALLKFAESSGEVESLLQLESDHLSGVRVASLLAAHYLKTAQFDEAFRFSLRQDSLQNYRGTALFQFMNQGQEHKTYQPMLRMAKYMIDNDSLFSNQVRVRFFHGAALTGLERYDEAILTYQKLLAVTPTSLDSGDAMYAIGKIYMDKLRNFEQALAYFDSVTTFHRRGRTHLLALMARPQCLIRSGDLKGAKQNLLSLQRRIQGDDVREEIDYYLALINLFNRQFDSSETAFRKLMVDYPRGFYINDALQLVLLLGEAEGSEELLGDFSRAIYFETRIMKDSSREYFQRLADAENNALGDVALYKLARTDIDAADSSLAKVNIELLITEFPESYYLPFGLKIKADMLAESSDGIEKALALYQSLLEDYPNYPFITEVRKTMRQLQEIRPVG